MGGRADVRQGHHVVQGEQRRFGQRFLLVDIQAGAEDALLPQGGDQRGLVDHLAAGDVDQDRRGFHQAQFARTDQLPGLRSQRHHHADEVGLAEQFVEAEEARAEFLFQFRLAVVAVVEHLHAEAETAAPGDGRADPAEAEDAEFLAMHVGAELRGVDGALPVPGLDPGVQLGDPSRGADQQGEAEVGGGLGEDVGRVGESDAAAVQVVQVIVVVADRDAGDDFQLLRLFQLPGAERPADADHAVGIGQGGGVLGVDVALFRFEHADVELALQAFEMLGGEATEDEDVLFHDGTLQAGAKAPTIPPPSKRRAGARHWAGDYRLRRVFRVPAPAPPAPLRRAGAGRAGFP